MGYLVIILFILAVYDQHLSTELERDGHLARLLEHKSLRRKRTFTRVLGAAGVLLFFVLWRLG